MDVGSANQAQSVQFLTTNTGDVDGEAIMLALSLSQADTASESVKAGVKSLNQANSTSKFLHGLYDEFDNLLDDATSKLDDAVDAVKGAINTVADEIKDLVSDIQDIAQKIADKVVPDFEPAKSIAKAVIGDWEDDKNDLESEKSAKESVKTDLQSKQSDLQGGKADNVHVKEVLGDNLGLGDRPAALANYGVSVDTSSVDTAKESLPSIADATKRFDAQADSARDELMSEVSRLTSSAQQLGTLVSSLRNSGNKSLQSLTEAKNAGQKENDALFRDLAEQAETDSNIRSALEALSQYDELKSELGIPDDAASIVTGQLTQAQQEDVGRQLQEWLLESQRDTVSDPPAQGTGLRSLEQQAKRLRI